MSWKSLLKKIIPQSLLQYAKKPNEYGFFGNYASWEIARENSKGYDSPVIFEKIKEAAFKIKNGKASFERDTVTFKESEYNQFVLNALLESAKTGRLSVLDFGGSFGNVYLQHKKPLSKIQNLSWAVVEQKHIVNFGKKEFTESNDGVLSFFEDTELAKAIAEKKPNVVLFGSSLQYSPKPYETIDTMITSGVKTVIIDRTPFLDKDAQERIVVQKVHPRIYDASYPAWLLNENKLREFFGARSYKLVTEIKNGTMNLDGTKEIALKSFIYESQD